MDKKKWNGSFIWQGLAEELSKEGACDKAIFPDTDIVVDRCAIIANLNVEGVRKRWCIFHHNISLVILCKFIVLISVINLMSGKSLQGDRCDLNLVPGCMDTSSPFYNPLANVDDGSCPIDSDLED